MNVKAKIQMALLSAYILIPVAVYSWALISQKGLALSGFYFIFLVSFALLPLVLLRPFYWGIVIIPFLFFVPAEIIHILHYDGFSTISAFASVIESNRMEASEFLHNYRPYFYLLVPVAVLLTISHFLFIRPSHVISTRTKAVVGIAFIFTLGAFTAKTAYGVWARKHELNAVPVGLEELYTRLFTQNFPYAYIPKIYEYSEDRVAFDEALKRKADFKFGAQINPEVLSKNKPLLVMVIGESSRAVNWTLQGYKRDTTPELMARSDIYYCKDTTSSATQTRESLELALSRATPTNLTPVYHEKSLVSAFKEAGYSTVWISNQKMLGDVDTAVYEIAKEAAETHFLGEDYRYKSSYDEKIIPVLEKVLAKHREQATLIIIHTMGSHEIYRMRYPPAFEKFKPASKGDDYNWNSPGIRQRLLNSYDNSILYTDHVLNQIVTLVKKQNRNAGLMFFSDHGENILDGGTDRFGHGGVMPTKYVIHIPMFFWFSDGYKALFNNKVSNVQSNCQKQVSENDVFDTMLDLGDVKIKNYETKTSIAGNQLSGRVRHVLGATRQPLAITEKIEHDNKVSYLEDGKSL